MDTSRRIFGWTLRSAGAVLLVLGLLFLGLALAYPRLERAGLERVARELRDRHIDASWGRVDTRMNGLVSLGDVRISARGWRLSCDELAVNLSVSGLLMGHARADSLALGRCQAARAAEGSGEPVAAADVAHKAESVLGRPLGFVRDHVGRLTLGSLAVSVPVGDVAQRVDLTDVEASFGAGDAIRGAIAFSGLVEAASSPFAATVEPERVEVRMEHHLVIEAPQGRLEVGSLVLGDGPTLGVGEVTATSPRLTGVRDVKAAWIGVSHREGAWTLEGSGGVVTLEGGPPEGSGEGLGGAEAAEPPEPDLNQPALGPGKRAPEPEEPKGWLPSTRRGHLNKEGIWVQEEGPSPGQALVSKGLEAGRILVRLIDLARHDFYGAPRSTGGESPAPVPPPEGSGITVAIPKVTPMETPRRGRAPAPAPASETEAELGQAVARLKTLADKLSTALSRDREPIGLSLTSMGVVRGGVELAGIRRLTLSGEGHLDSDVALGGVAIKLRSELGREAPIELSASGLQIAPLSRILPMRTRVSGTLDLNVSIAVDTRRPSITVNGRAAVHDAVLDSPPVAPTPLSDWRADTQVWLGADLAGRGRFDVRVDGHFNAVPGFARVSVAPDLQTHTIRASVGFAEETECGTVWNSIPAAMLPNLSHEGARFSGAMQPVLAWVLRMNDPWSFAFDVKGFPGTCKVDWVKPGYDPMELTRPEYTFKVSQYVSKKDIVVGPGTPDYAPVTTMPWWVPAIMYLSEEVGFWGNRGISVPLMNKGIRISLERGRYVYGGSTISQQLVKNIYFTRTKTLSRKLEEAVVVWRMELIVPKQRILELYLNCIEFGPNLWGIRPAVRYYFGKEPSELTPMEATYLAALKPSPYQGAHDMRIGHSPESGPLPLRMAELMARFVQYGDHFGNKLTPEEVAYYAPYVVAFPTSPAGTGAYAPVPRPEWAVKGEPPPPGLLPGDPAAPPVDPLDPTDPNAPAPVAPSPDPAPAPAPPDPVAPSP